MYSLCGVLDSVLMSFGWVFDKQKAQIKQIWKPFTLKAQLLFRLKYRRKCKLFFSWGAGLFFSTRGTPWSLHCKDLHFTYSSPLISTSFSPKIRSIAAQSPADEHVLFGFKLHCSVPLVNFPRKSCLTSEAILNPPFPWQCCFLRAFGSGSENYSL